MLAIDGRVVMVSGASRGLGRAVVERLLAAGFRVSAGMRRPGTAADSEQLMTHRYEAKEAGSAEAWVAATVQRFGQVDALVNAAGINPRARVCDSGEAQLDEMWAVNVKGPLRVIRAAMPALAACGHGRVINIASLSAKRVASNVGYAMTKHALLALTHGVRREGRAAGIRATVVCPGYINTDMAASETEIPHAEMTQPGDLAEMIEFLLRLPNNAAVSELLVHCQYEPML